MTEQEKRKYRVCFTGHRPERLKASEETVKKVLAHEIEQAYQDGFKIFITGMARGVDIWAAELVLEFRIIHKDVHLICAIPFPDMEKSWKAEWQVRYRAVLDGADLSRIIYPHFSKGAYQIRNEWMVNRAAMVIAVFDGTPSGGTFKTIRYAQEQGVEVRMAMRCQNE